MRRLFKLCSGWDDEGKCIVCYQECSTKACRCSCMHKECAREYIEKFKNSCVVCGGTIRVTFLEKRAADEQETLVEQVPNARDRQKYRAWRRLVWPHVATVLRVRRVDVHVALLTILNDSDYQNSIVQCMMNSGMDRGEADILLSEIMWTAQNYEVLSQSIKKVIESGFQRRLRVAYAWD